MNVIISNIRISYFSTWNLGDKLGKSCTLFSKSGILEDDRSKLSEMKQIYIYIYKNKLVTTFPYQLDEHKRHCRNISTSMLPTPFITIPSECHCLILPKWRKNGEWLCLSGQSCYEEVSLDPSEEIMPPLSLRPRWQKNSNVFRFYPPSWVSF